MSDDPRVCTHPGCEHSGELQPVENFRIRSDSGTRRGWCNECWAKASKEAMRRHREHAASFSASAGREFVLACRKR
jgi:hypothetical protein